MRNHPTIAALARRAMLRGRSAWFRALAPRPASGAGRFTFSDGRVSARIDASEGATIRLSGDVDFRSSFGDWGTATITMNRGARLHVDGDIVIGPGTVIVVDAGATLRIGGRRAGSGSGFTARTTILVRRSVDIGHDCIVGPDTFISDCDWHSTDGSPEYEATIIGDWVWVARGASISKGACIGAGCIVAAGAVCRRNNYPERTLIAGVPASVAKLGVRWTRELVADAIRAEQP